MIGVPNYNMVYYQPRALALQNLWGHHGWSKESDATTAPVVETKVGTTSVLAPTPDSETHIATLTNVNGSDLKVVSTDSGTAKVDKLVNDGTTTFTAPSTETDTPSATVAVIVDKTTNQPVAKVETKLDSLGDTSSDPATPENPKVVAVLNNVDGSNLKVVGTTEPEAQASNDGSLAVATTGSSDVPLDSGSSTHNDPIAIVDDGSGLHVGRLTTSGELNVYNNLESGNNYIIDLETSETSVVNFGLVMLI